MNTGPSSRNHRSCRALRCLSAICLVPFGALLAQSPAPSSSSQVTLEEVVVTAESDSSYTVTGATTATKLDTPLKDIPQTINVIPREVLDDRGVTRVQEVADNVPGVQYSSGYGGLSSGSFFIRGFSSGGTYRDGFKDFGFLSPVDVAGLERIEFLKGPSSVLYGQNDPGGIVNYVSKRPVPYSINELGFTYGSYDLYRAAGDFGGTLLSREIPGTPASAKNPKAPVTGPSTEPVLTYRLTGAYEDAGSHRDFNESESYYIGPSLTWHITPDTTLTLFGEYQRYDYVFDRGLLPVRQTFQLPTSRFLGEPSSYAETESWRAGYEFVHKFSDDLQFRSAFAAIHSEQDSHFAQASSLGADGRTVSRSSTRRHEESKNYTLQNELSGRFNTGAVEHHALVGVELARYEFGYNIGFGPLSSLDIFRPVYGADLGEVPFGPWDEYGADSLALYLQDQITLTEQFKILLGIRYDHVESYYNSMEQTDEAFSPRVGFVFQPWEPVSFFAGWSTGFNPNFFSVSADGSAFDPEESEQFEAGVKLELVKNKLTSTIAVYDITKENVLTTDPANPEYSILTGEQKSRGAEFDLIGTPIPGWNIVASYAYTDAYVSEDTNIPSGTKLSAVPEHQAGLWTSYEFQAGALKGFGLGAGAYFVDDRPATMPGNGVTLPGYWRFDASLFYKQEKWSAQVNFKNISDERIYESTGYNIYPDAPFNVQASLTFRF